MEKEIWREISGYNGLYLVSNLGRIKSKHRSNRILKPKISKHGKSIGYSFVNLRINNKSKTLSIHRIVANAFIPNKNNKAQVNHKNKLRSDNRASNLEWNTNIENQGHKHDVFINQSKSLYISKLKDIVLI